ncbi:MAG: polymer-forming cytoskeletal protein [Persicimonas sp.]
MADTLIGRSIVIDGEISGDAPVVVEGTVKGRINLDSTVNVSEEGVVEADIESDQVEISGSVTGNIAAGDRVEIRPEGRVVGDIRSPRILIADGASFKGHIDMDVE